MSQPPDTLLEPQPPQRMPATERSFLKRAGIALGVALAIAVLGIVTLFAAGALVIRLLTPPETVVGRMASPSGKWELVAFESDHGGLGGEVYVTLAPSTKGQGQARTVAIHGTWGSRPYLKWIDGDTFSIDGQEADVGDRQVLHLDR